MSANMTTFDLRAGEGEFRVSRDCYVCMKIFDRILEQLIMNDVLNIFLAIADR